MNTQTEPVKKDNLRKSNQESKELTRQYIKTALLYLIKKKPFEKITVTAIIQRAGVSRSGFYRNYASKEEVLEDISKTVYQRLSQYYMKEMCENTPYERALFLFRRLKENAEWFHLALILGTQNKQIFNMDAYVEQFLSPQTPTEHYLYIAIAYSQRAVIVNWFENGMKESPEEMAEIFINLYRNMDIFSIS